MKFLITLLIFTQSFYLFSQNGQIDTTFFSNDIGYGSGYSGLLDLNPFLKPLFKQSNGKMIFQTNNAQTHYSGFVSNGPLRVNSNGIIDTSFKYSDLMYSGTASSGVEFSDGTICLTGQYYTQFTVGIRHFVFLDANGNFLNSHANILGCGQINKMIRLSDGNILASGNFCSVYGSNRNGIAKFLGNSSGVGLFNTFNPVISGPTTVEIYDMVVQSDDKIIIVGNFTSVDGNSRNGIARLNPNGSLDLTFNPGSGINSGVVNKIEVLTTGKIILGGNFSSYNGFLANNLIRINSDGSFDNTFNSNLSPIQTISSILSTSSNSIICVGDFNELNGLNYSNLKKYKTDGSEDTTFDIGSGFASPINNPYYSQILFKNTDTSFYVFGPFNFFNEKIYRNHIELDTNGILIDQYSKSTGFNGKIKSLEVLSDQSILVSGDFNAYFGNYIPSRLIKLTPYGTVDSSFNAFAVDSLTQYDFALNSDGSILRIVEFFDGFTFNDSLIKLNPNGTLNNTFQGVANVNENSYIKTLNTGEFLITTQPDEYTFLLDLKKVFINGNVDPSFSINTNINGLVRDIEFNSLNQIFVVGDFTQFNNLNTNNIVKLDNNGNIVQLFDNLNINGSIYQIEILDDNSYIIVGDFTSVNTINCQGIIKFNANNQIDTNFLLNEFNSYFVPLTLSKQRNGKLLVGGSSYNVPGDKISVQRLYPNGLIDTNFTEANNSFFSNPAVNKILNVNDEKLLVAGNFLNWGEYGRNGLVRLDNCITEIGRDTVVACDYFTWINGVTYTSSTHDYATIITANNCDSLIELFLTVNYSSHSYDTIVNCDDYTWVGVNGVTYLNSGDYTDTLINSVGCDSILHLNLTINYSSYNFDTITSCGSYSWPVNGITYFNSGEFSDTLINQYGCDSILNLSLTILPVYSYTDTITSCDSCIWTYNNQTYYLSGFYSDTLTNIYGCDSIISLALTIYNPLNSFSTFYSNPSAASLCNGQLAITTTGNSDFEITIDGGAPFSSSGYSLQSNLCPGIHELSVIDFCGDTVTQPFVIPIDSNYVFNNPFIDSIAVDSLGTTITNCDIYYNSIDTAYIDSLWATGTQVNVIWNIVDSNGSNIDTTTYDLMNGSGVYWLQLSVFCPTKSTEDYFTVTQAIYFGNGGAYLVGLEDIEHLQNNIGLFPNPTSNSVTITFNSTNTAQVKMYDTQGKLIQNHTLISGETISMEHLEKGVYLVTIECDGNSYLKRIIKQ